MTLARQTALPRTDMRAAIREEVNDPATNRSSVTIPAAQRRFSDTECDRALNYALMELGKDLGGQHLGENLLYADGTYSGTTSNLPSGALAGDLIYKVEDITDSSRPIPIPYVSPLEIERYAVSTQAAVDPYASWRYTLLASGTTPQIVIRPQPRSTLSIRVYYVAPPIVTAADGDTHAFTAHWYEYLVLAAALRLLRRDDEGSVQQQQDMERLRRQVQAFANRQAGPRRIRSVRKWR